MKSKPSEEIISKFRQALREDEKQIFNDVHIYSIDDIPAADGYIRYENLIPDFQKICDRLGVDMPEIPRLKTAQRAGVKLPYQAYYDMECRDIVAEAFGQEIEHFKWRFDET